MGSTAGPGEPASTLADVVAYYAADYERDRLDQGRSRLERDRTREILLRHLPPPPATLLDVGGGPGAYSFWLASLGYVVHLIDATPAHVEQARQRAIQLSAAEPASIQVGDARHLDRPNESVDAVLLLGPLYHLTERADRLLAIHEARRVVKTGGPVFAAGISRFASLFDGFTSSLYDDPAFVQIVERDLESGQHRNPTNKPDYFTTAYFHRPDELKADVEECGLTVQELLGIEGPGYWTVPDLDGWWSDPARRERLLAAARAVENEPSLLGVGPHLMVVARRV
jgi:ubiquinone/menaquinone biosynthesis C-methylase UbiE